MPEIIHGLSDSEYRDGSHFGIHALRLFDEVSPRAFWRAELAEKSDRVRTASKAMELGTAIDLHLFGERERDGVASEYDRRVTVRPDVYPSSELNREAYDKAVEDGKEEHAVAVKKWDAAKAKRPSHLTVAEWTKANPKPKVADFKPSRDDYSDVIEKPWSGSAGWCQDWTAAHDGGLILTKPEDELCRSYGERISHHPWARELMGFGYGQATIRDVWEGVPIQCRFDWLATDCHGKKVWRLVDGKKVSNLGRFKRQVIDLGYDRQAAWYQWMYQQLTGELVEWRWLVYEEAWPHRVKVFKPSDALLRRAHEMNCKMLEQIAELWPMRDDRMAWPEPSEEGEGEIDLPSWVDDSWRDVEEDASWLDD